MSEIEKCPFCGGECICEMDIDGPDSDGPDPVGWLVCCCPCEGCQGCGYVSGVRQTSEEAIAAHNRVARAVQLVNEFYENDTERDVFFNRIQVELSEKKDRKDE